MKGKVFTFLLLGSAAFAGSLRADAPSAAHTMRVDYYHTGKAGADEVFALDRVVVVEPLLWPGNPKRPLDDSGLGEYFFEVIDRSTQTPLYSRGFSTCSTPGSQHPPRAASTGRFKSRCAFPSRASR